ncbi:hypothetical protein Bbelb_285280 [Branchiostoma belcheri]|nr:hypothetical protein Bbelb_285280 [Branchiostoma belcheri]
MAAGGNTETETELEAAFKIVQSDLGEDWIDLGLELGLKYNIVEELMNTYKSQALNLIWRNRTMLERWRRQKGKQATVQELLNALKKIRRQDLVDRLKDLYPDLQDTEQLNIPETSRASKTPPLSPISTVSSNESKKVKKTSVKKARKGSKGKRHKRKGHSNDLKFVKCSVRSMQHAKQKGKKCFYLVIETPDGSELDDDSLDLCKEIIVKHYEDFDIGDYWSSSICVQMFPKTDESISELNKHQESGKLTADLQTGFEKTGLNCPLEVNVLTMEELKDEVSEIVEEAMDIFVLSEMKETGEESTQTYEELRDAWRDTLLRITAWTGDEDKVKTLLQAGVQVNTENSEGETPLWDAVRGGHPNIVKLLLQKGAKTGGTLLLAAQIGNNADIVSILIQAGAKLNMVDPRGRTPLWWAANGGDVPVVKVLTKAGSDLNKADDEGTTPLLVAAENGHAEVVSILAQARADLNKADGEGRTPLFVAAWRDHREVVSVLTQAGADLNMADHKGKTPMYMAAKSRHAEVVSILIQAGADLDKADNERRTPLWEAAQRGNTPIVKILTQAGADLNMADHKARTPLSVAAEIGHARVVSILTQAGADLNKADVKQKTPLWIAAHRGHMIVVKALIEAGADVSIQDKTGKTPYQAAVEMGHDNVAKVIEEGKH